jgi:hypothetical protein
MAWEARGTDSADAYRVEVSFADFGVFSGALELVKGLDFKLADKVGFDHCDARRAANLHLLLKERHVPEKGDGVAQRRSREAREREWPGCWRPERPGKFWNSTERP